MELIVKRFDELSSSELYDMLRCRSEVFVVEQDCACQDLDGDDYVSTHLFLRHEGRIVAYLRIIDPGVRHAGTSIGRVLTIKEFRGQGLARRLMLEAIQIARTLAPEIEIEAQSYLCDFYRSLGFEAVSGEFIYERRPHVRMILR